MSTPERCANLLFQTDEKVAHFIAWIGSSDVPGNVSAKEMMDELELERVEDSSWIFSQLKKLSQSEKYSSDAWYLFTVVF